MPPKKTKQPNQRDTRHENGLAAPGKRVTRKHSNGQLANGKPATPASPPALPSTGLNQGFRFSHPPTLENCDPEDASQTPTQDYAAATDATIRDSTAPEATMEEVATPLDTADCANEPASAAAPAVEAQAPTRKFSYSNFDNPLSTVSTILAYYPLRDAISILILLLSLPPTLVLLIQTLFASLTFVPPTVGISLSTLPNIKEIFHASSVGYPGLVTVMIVDLIFWGVWLATSKAAQNVMLDFSQAVIAVSLSGAAASPGGATYSIVASCTIVCVVHVLRYRAIHLTALDYLRSVLHKMDIGIQLDGLPSASSFIAPPNIERGWVFSAIRTVLGIHIVSQGVTTWVRRILVRVNERDQTVPAITSTEAEAAVPASDPSSRLPTAAPEVSQPPQVTSSTDGRPPGPSPSQRDGKVRESSSKKKKRQATQVRSQQPLWAAIASTKVTFVKEMEQRDAADDAREAALMDTNDTKPVSASTTNHNTNRVWIFEVLDTEVYFTVEMSHDAATQSVEKMEEGVSVSAGIDKSKPFFVRINGAAWSSTRIMSSATGEESDGKPRFDGEIFDLAPRGNYRCEIVGIASGQVLCSMSLITQAAPSAEQTAATPTQPQHPALRPSSPITTLKQSIQSAEAKLNEARNRSKKSKKDQKGVISEIRREINTLKGKLDSSGGLDDKQERRIQQITQHKNQAEEATVELKAQIDAFGDIPENEQRDFEAKKSAWQAAVNAKRRAEKELLNAKTDADRDLGSLKSDMDASKSKHERMEARLAQRIQELEKLTSKQQADMTAKQKRDYERAQVVQRRNEDEAQIRANISSMEAETSTYETKGHEANQQLAAIQSWNAAPPAYPGPQTNGFPTYGPHAFGHSTYVPHQQTNSYNNQGPRGRSSSMLSQYSGFTEGGEEQPPFIAANPQQQHGNTWPMYTYGHAVGGVDRKESEGSNGSTGSNSPRPDAKPFTPKSVGTIGPPSKKRDQAQQSPPGAVGDGR
ncbi:hypothetical protein BAUCODRAFT_365284 [Baudoinia panamericana UAMH 10762]|uniref:Ubiquitination network signaling protein acrB n=1 Tax=Baudoinia panamericana (strain UAMH 10762) TaxID=717646 RepID=M2NKW7_BAUPA|nr:uncharacterized protein BAUCODRAFT_365284 [Baudoinia panamericana UAMH 10762]EMD00100.1 hypothetical protein BAUCODRAFT_365284 [Baudoinia panamericana UAMH 10762]